ncbi:MAG: nitrilase-related carbon-nitrogen hydrolase [Candidatus Bathyarchaeia archaeon]
MSGKEYYSAVNLVQNPSFEKNRIGMPENWYKWSPRSELEPKVQARSDFSHSGQWSLWMSGEGKPACYGKLGQVIKGIVPGNSYRFKVYFRTLNVKSIRESVVVQLSWITEGSTEINMDYINDLRKEGDWRTLEGIATAPQKAESLEIELIFRWSEGSIWWDDVELIETLQPECRKVKICTVHFRPKEPSTVQRNIDLYTDLLDVAGRGRADIVCLPECITSVCVNKSIEEVAQPIPGPATDRLSEKANKYKMYVVASLYERAGSCIYNTAVLIDRNGRIIGKYRKTHLPHGEIKSGVTPGSEYPVFETDFGKVGLEICYDIFFPEVTKILALKGAIMILLPIWGCWIQYGNESWYATARSRALDNSIYLVASMYDGNSLIVGPDGGILANSEGEEGVFFAETELVDKGPPSVYVWPHVKKYEWRRMYPRDRRPETYSLLVEYE